ncbi:unnamed protein product [Tuwongella immobilis]|uniref:Uncharacterized protein n=2 Tax=Tuwongella immobilis TaxID=692036 RepID=A0A6C2YQA5_9BACT|nr:unnamed protein product [Tuwongella immobilis]VTS04680.1 unnamed protein product [Tuwongella immobilis]
MMPSEGAADFCTAESLREFMSASLHAPLVPRPLPPAPDAEWLTHLQSQSLTSEQIEAIWWGWTTPDCFWIEGESGTGKTALIRHWLDLAQANQKRLLIVMSNAASIDAWLQSIPPPTLGSIVRCLGRIEKPNSLSAPSARHLHESQFLRWLQPERDASANELARIHATIQQLEPLAPQWQALEQLAEPLAECQARLAQVRQHRDSIESQVQSEFVQWQSTAAVESEWLAPMQERSQRHLAESEERQQQHAKLQQHRQAICEQIELQRLQEVQVASQEQARKEFRITSGSFWKGLLQGSQEPQLQSHRNQLEQLGQQLHELDEAIAQLLAAEVKATENWHAEQSRLRVAEIERRQQLAQTEIDALQQSQVTLVQKREIFRRPILDAFPDFPEDPTPEQRSQYHALWESSLRDALQMRESLQARCEFWQQESDRRDEFRARLTAVVSLPGVIGWESAVGNSETSRPFDLAIFDDCQAMPENELFAASRLAKRWICLSRIPSAHGERRWDRDLERLSQRLRPLGWRCEAGRWIARLVSLTETQRRRLECEPLADCPECELRIDVSQPDSPQLAEIAFPPGGTLADAKRRLAEELQLRWLHPALGWRCTTDSASTVPIGRSAPPHATPETDDSIEWPDGARERFHPQTGQTFQLESESTALSDTHESTKPQTSRECGEWRIEVPRFVKFATLVRQLPGLRDWVHELVEGGELGSPPELPNRQHKGIVRFKPVPATADSHPKRAARHDDAPFRDPLQCGSGLDTDLSDPRQRAKLPARIAEALPPFGFVNLTEAHTIREWCQALAESAPLQRVVVSALYQAQVQLIRELWLREPDGVSPQVQILAPQDAIHCECDRLMVSLTRSHPARAVVYGEKLEWLAELCRRPRVELCLTGDVGGLIRRARWEHPIDPLNSEQSKIERQRLSVLAKYLQGHGRLSEQFQLEMVGYSRHRSAELPRT